ncbi:MAG: hypothetical protein RL081_1109, partial [Pseudomonadota bacterium]
MFSVPDSVVEPHAGAVGGGRARRSLWVVPLVASIAFVTGVLVWAYRTEMDEQTERRSTMIADALSSEAQLRARLDTEMARLEDLGRHLATVPRNAAGLAGDPVVVEGLRGLWLSVTWLDSNNRIVAHVPDQQPLSGLRIKDLVDGPGVSSHLTLQAGGERLIVRYSPALLLRRGIPWWLTRKYDVQLVDASEQVIASVDEVPLRLESDGRLSYMVLVGGNMPGAYLELTSRELPLPLWRTLPLVLIGGFLALMLISTVLLRRQVRQITRAQDAWRTEAAWRQAMGDSALVGLRARDLEGRILYVNRTFCDMVGLPAQVLVGLMPPMPYWPPEVADEMALRNQRNLEGHAPREGYESLWRHQDGRLINVMVFESPLIDARGKQTGWMGSIIDITARKQLEERERHQAEAMAYQSRLTTLGEVASALAHQLNQPLTAIMGYNGGLQRMLGNPGYDVDAVRNALKNQGDQAAEAGRIVRRIREFLTRRGPQREACQLDAIARRAVELVQRDLKTRGAGADQPGAQRRGCDGGGWPWRQCAHRLRQCRAGVCAAGCGRRWSGPGRSHNRAVERPLLFHQSRWHGDGAGHLPLGDRGAPRRHGCGQEFAGRCTVFVHPAGVRSGAERRITGGRGRAGRMGEHGMTLTTSPAAVHLVDDEAPVRAAMEFLLRSHGLAVF